MGLRTGDDKLRQIIINTPEFHNAEGVFDQDRYKMLVRSGGYTTKQYQAARKADMASTQFINVIQNTNFVLKNELDLNIHLQNQTRDFNYLIVPQDYYLKQVDLSGEKGDADIQSYYEMNKTRFAIPEKVSVEYLHLTKNKSDTITISNGQIADYYNENISDFESTERRRVAHILVTVSDDDEQKSEAAAETKINQLAARITAGESFEDVARDGSEDDSTAESGGDLDWIEPGMMDEAFETVAFDLSLESPISTVVKTDFGFHLIKLLEVESGDAKPLEELKGQITGILQDQFVEDKFFDLKDKVSEEAFELSDSLVEIADDNKLVVKKTGLFDRQFGIGLPAELQSQPSILESAFSEDVLYQSLNSELVELSDGSAVVLRLLEHQEAGVMPLDEVKSQIVNLLKQQRVREATEQAGNEIIAALKEGKSSEEVITILPEEISANWEQQTALGRDGTEVNAQLRNDIFKIPAPAEGQLVYKGILLNSGDYAVVELKAVTEGIAKVDDEAASATRDKQFTDYYTQAEMYNYLKYLDAKATISRQISNTSLIQ